MKKLYLVLLVCFSIFISACCSNDNIDTAVSADYNTVIVTAALEEMYWLEYMKEYTKEELDNISTNEEIKKLLEEKLKVILLPIHIEKIEELRKDANYDF